MAWKPTRQIRRAVAGEDSHLDRARIRADRDGSARRRRARVRAENRRGTNSWSRPSTPCSTVSSSSPNVCDAGQPAERRHARRPRNARRGRLTPREREVLQLLTEGKSNKEIGAALGMTTKTAETHRAHIMTKLDLHSTSELVRYAIRNRIIEA